MDNLVHLNFWICQWTIETVGATYIGEMKLRKKENVATSGFRNQVLQYVDHHSSTWAHLGQKLLSAKATAFCVSFLDPISLSLKHTHTLSPPLSHSLSFTHTHNPSLSLSTHIQSRPIMTSDIALSLFLILFIFRLFLSLSLLAFCLHRFSSLCLFVRLSVCLIFLSTLLYVLSFYYFLHDFQITLTLHYFVASTSAHPPSSSSWHFMEVTQRRKKGTTALVKKLTNIFFSKEKLSKKWQNKKIEKW